jgi:hypothetical protein
VTDKLPPLLKRRSLKAPYFPASLFLSRKRRQQKHNHRQAKTSCIQRRNQLQHPGPDDGVPAKTPGGEWSFSTDTTVCYRDRHNWDGTKSTDSGPVNITDQQLGRLNEVGIAQNCNMTGESSTHHSSGRVK